MITCTQDNAGVVEFPRPPEVGERFQSELASGSVVEWWGERVSLIFDMLPGTVYTYTARVVATPATPARTWTPGAPCPCGGTWGVCTYHGGES